MEKPVIAGKQSAVLELEPRTYHWCACGRSKNQP
jgi:CDGSH-type Zn-finger protein